MNAANAIAKVVYYILLTFTSGKEERVYVDATSQAQCEQQMVDQQKELVRPGLSTMFCLAETVKP